MKTELNLILLLFTFLLQSCNTTEPPPPVDDRKLTLTFEEASCTEIWLRLGTENISLPVEITIKKDDAISRIINPDINNTIIYIDSLLPNKTYTFKAELSGIQNPVSSNELQAVTLDTTSHNFTWQKFTFGVGASSIFRDVAIIGEEIWAVGEIYSNDSLGNPDPNAYNALHWDGQKRELKRISVLYNENLITPPLFGIYAFSSNDIWLSSGVPVHGDGASWTQYHLFDMGILSQDDGYLTKIWGSSSSDLYYVGTLGTIVHYNGTSWRKIESGTEWNILDIWGDTNPFTNEIEIICGIGKGLDQPGPWSDIIRIKEDFTTEKLDITGLGQVYAKLWFRSGIRYYIVGDGLYEKTFSDTSAWNDLNQNWSITSYFKSCIRGNGLNDIVVAGAQGEFLHYNGITWKSFRNQTSLNNGTYYSVAIKGNIIVAVGSDQSQAVILIGNHQ
jgi:hypothetical protein